MRRPAHMTPATATAQDPRHAKVRQVGSVVQEFRHRARNAAVSLYTVSYACQFLPGVRESQCDIARTLFALFGSAHGWAKSMRIAGLFDFASPTRPTFFAEYSLQDLEDVEKCMASCEPIFNKVDAAREMADKYVRPGSKLPLEKGLHRIGAFPRDEDVEAQRVLTNCIHAFARMSMAAEMEHLEGRAEL